MSTLNPIQALFSLIILLFILLGGLICFFEKYVPAFVQQIVRYGKASQRKQPTYFKIADLPKSWFKHFYIWGSSVSSLTLALIIAVYLLNFKVPRIIIIVLNFIAGETRIAHVNSASVLLATILHALQNYRRLYETHYISVFSKDGRLIVPLYLIGYIYYLCVMFTILLEAPLFAGNAFLVYEDYSLKWGDITYLQLGATVLYVWSWWQQHKVIVALANLRKDKRGSVVTEKHKLPHGGWFNYVSVPHNTAEILMYIALSIILWGNTTWLYIFGFVITNQILAALLNHWWYQENFTDMPKGRKAVIPFIW